MEKKITRTMQGTMWTFMHNDYPPVTGFNLTADEVLNLLSDGYTLADKTVGNFKLSVPETTFIAAADIEEVKGE